MALGERWHSGDTYNPLSARTAQNPYPVGYTFRRIGVPTVPIILGILLGNKMEDSLRRAVVISDGDWTYLFSSGIATGLWIAAVAGFIAPMFLRKLLAKPEPIAD